MVSCFKVNRLARSSVFNCSDMFGAGARKNYESVPLIPGRFNRSFTGKFPRCIFSLSPPGSQRNVHCKGPRKDGNRPGITERNSDRPLDRIRTYPQQLQTAATAPKRIYCKTNMPSPCLRVKDNFQYPTVFSPEIFLAKYLKRHFFLYGTHKRHFRG